VLGLPISRPRLPTSVGCCALAATFANYEHVISRQPLAARIQRMLDATFYPPIAGGCHAARDTGEAIRHAGFQIMREERIAFKPSPLLPAIPHILGAASSN
jgi:hypothetical protein